MSAITYHNHHIIPRHAGGTDAPENIVRLTTEEHAEAHRKLYEEHGRWQDRLAWRALAGMIGKEEIIREKIMQTARGPRKKGYKMPPRTEEHIRKWRVATIGKKHTPERRANMRIAQQRRVKREKELGIKQRKSPTPFTEEHKKKLSVAATLAWEKKNGNK
ncbi:MAG TPA: HNH endonuclease [Flavobacteriales bacterium]|jgi:hypothetical protein|nr:HNH endonuclease [Flavobacteriales bacterium]